MDVTKPADPSPQASLSDGQRAVCICGKEIEYRVYENTRTFSPHTNWFHLGTNSHLCEFRVAIPAQASPEPRQNDFLRDVINEIEHVYSCDMHNEDGQSDPDNCQRCALDQAFAESRVTAPVGQPYERTSVEDQLTSPDAERRRQEPHYGLLVKLDQFLHKLMEAGEFKDEAGNLHGEVHEAAFQYVTKTEPITALASPPQIAQPSPSRICSCVSTVTVGTAIETRCETCGGTKYLCLPAKLPTECEALDYTAAAQPSQVSAEQLALQLCLHGEPLKGNCCACFINSKGTNQREMASAEAEATPAVVERQGEMKHMEAIDFYNANATNVINVPRVDHPEDPSGIAGVRRCMEARFFAEDALVMSLSDACDFAEAYVSSSRAAKP